MGRRKASLGPELADVDLRLLRIFKAIVDHGGIAAAEPELNLANSTISNHLSDLEGRLGMSLCERGRKGFGLTDEGREVYRATLELLAAVDQFRASVHRSRDALVGTLRLAIEEFCLFACEDLLMAAVRRFTATAPNVYVDLQTLPADRVAQAVASGQVALGISAMAAPPGDLAFRPLGVSEHMQLYCGREHPLYNVVDESISMEELGRHKFIETHKLRPGRALIPEVEKWYRQASALQYEPRALLIRSGSYLGYLSQQYVSHMGWEGQMRPLLPDKLNYHNEYAVIIGKKALKNPVNEAFLACLSAAS